MEKTPVPGEEGLETKVNRWTAERIDIAYDELKEKLGRSPERKEFIGAFGRYILKLIHTRCYNPCIRNFSQYVNYRESGLLDEKLVLRGAEFDLLDAVSLYGPEKIETLCERCGTECSVHVLDNMPSLLALGLIGQICDGKAHRLYVTEKGEDALTKRPRAKALGVL
jgi:hypothetical protein